MVVLLATGVVPPVIAALLAAGAMIMRPGQSFWGDQHTHGGWYRGTPQLKAMLVHAGLPSSAPRHRSLLSLALAIVRHLLP